MPRPVRGSETGLLVLPLEDASESLSPLPDAVFCVLPEVVTVTGNMIVRVPPRVFAPTTTMLWAPAVASVGTLTAVENAPDVFALMLPSTFGVLWNVMSSLADAANPFPAIWTSSPGSTLVFEGVPVTVSCGHAVADGVGEAVGDADGEDVGVGVADGDALGDADGDAVGVGEADGHGVGLGVAEPVGVGDAEPLGAGVGVLVGAGVGVGVVEPVGVGVGVAVACAPPNVCVRSAVAESGTSSPPARETELFIRNRYAVPA